jgi:hypothetical protein
MNFIIVLALIIQVVFSAFSKLTGAIIGYLITTGILGWGLTIYGSM